MEECPEGAQVLHERAHAGEKGPGRPHSPPAVHISGIRADHEPPVYARYRNAYPYMAHLSPYLRSPLHQPEEVEKREQEGDTHPSEILLEISILSVRYLHNYNDVEDCHGRGSNALPGPRYGRCSAGALCPPPVGDVRRGAEEYTTVES